MKKISSHSLCEARDFFPYVSSEPSWWKLYETFINFNVFLACFSLTFASRMPWKLWKVHRMLYSRDSKLISIYDLKTIKKFLSDNELFHSSTARRSSLFVHLDILSYSKRVHFLLLRHTVFNFYVGKPRSHPLSALKTHLISLSSQNASLNVHLEHLDQPHLVTFLQFF